MPALADYACDGSNPKGGRQSAKDTSRTKVQGASVWGLYFSLSLYFEPCYLNSVSTPLPLLWLCCDAWTHVVQSCMLQSSGLCEVWGSCSLYSSLKCWMLSFSRALFLQGLQWLACISLHWCFCWQFWGWTILHDFRVSLEGPHVFRGIWMVVNGSDLNLLTSTSFWTFSAGIACWFHV